MNIRDRRPFFPSAFIHLARPTILYTLLSVFICGTGCRTAAEHQQSLGSTQERQMTLGTVQKELRKGMSQADVAAALGSPNIVTRDSDGREAWIYDRAASEASYSNGGSYLTLVIFGIGESAGASSSTQRTLTVVIKYDAQSQVDSFAYHASRF